jgi:hypothetical protein
MSSLTEAGSGATWVVLGSVVLLSLISTLKFMLLLSLCRKVLRRLDPEAATFLVVVALLVLALKGRRWVSLDDLGRQVAAFDTEARRVLRLNRGLASGQLNQVPGPAESPV